MQRRIRHVGVLILGMFAALLVSVTAIQVVHKDTLAADGRNTRILGDRAHIQRGAIVVGGVPVAESVAAPTGWQRVYRDGPLYSAVTGFSPVDGQATGLEASLDERLHRPNELRDMLDLVARGSVARGVTIQTTIDPRIQQAAWDALGDRQGAVVALDPRTGRILALVSKPAFDPNVLASPDAASAEKAYTSLAADPAVPLVNRAIAGALNPPGSTFKLVMTAAALSNGRFTPDTLFDNPAELSLPGTSTTVQNDTRSTCGSGRRVSLATALVLSCNIPFAQLGMQMDPAAIKRQAELFGFNRGIDIGVPVAASTYPLYTDPAERAIGSFGQFDDRATPLQMAMVSAAVANNGVLMKPRLIDAVVDPVGGSVEETAPEELSRPMSPAAAQIIQALMVEGVERGAAHNAALATVAVAGKTGTAENGREDPYTLWFTGYASSGDAQVALSVVIEDGGGHGQDGGGNSIAAPVARKIFAHLDDHRPGGS